MRYPLHATVKGPLVLVGFGSIGQGTLPLIERHIAFDRSAAAIVEPAAEAAPLIAATGLRHVPLALTAENYADVLRGLFPQGGGALVNLSVDVDSLALMALCQDLGTLYIDTVIEPWPGFYFGSDLPNAARTNAPLREKMRALGRAYPGGATAVSCCGANPGMVSWLLKEALLRLAEDTGHAGPRPGPHAPRAAWAAFAESLGVKGLHVAERDTQIARTPKAPGVFVNTWSVDGLLSEGFQPAELGWGSHERDLPPGGHRFDEGPDYAIWIDRPGIDTRVRSWCPSFGPQIGFVITHNEALSIADYYTVWEGEKVRYRPTCHYAYHPCNDALLSVHEALGADALQSRRHVLKADDIASGGDDLGVLLYGHAKGALWYGSRLSIEETRALVPGQNATGLQVSSAVLAALVWAVENPRAGFVEADEMDHARCLEVQRPYLGRIEAHYTDWTPLAQRIAPFGPKPRYAEDPWQFTHFLLS